MDHFAKPGAVAISQQTRTLTPHFKDTPQKPAPIPTYRTAWASLPSGLQPAYAQNIASWRLGKTIAERGASHQRGYRWSKMTMRRAVISRLCANRCHQVKRSPRVSHRF